jgi:hypothetical protein
MMLIWEAAGEEILNKTAHYNKAITVVHHPIQLTIQ